MKTCPSYGMLTGRDRLSAVSNLPALTKVTLHSDVCVAYTARHGKARRASPVRRLARYGSSTLSEKQYLQTRQNKPGMGGTVVGRFRKTRRHDWTQAGIHDPRLCVRTYTTTGAKAGRGASPSVEFGQGYAVIEPDSSGIRRAAFRSQCFPHPETLHPPTLPPHTRRTPTTCLW